MDIPESMKDELGAWNNGAGIDLDAWVGCMGNFALATGYAAIFWPRFVEFEGYILREGFSESALRGCGARDGQTRQGVEWLLNHLHIADIQFYGCPDISKDKIVRLGEVLEEIHEAKLKWQFPDRPCVVEFYRPEDEDDLMQYQISFWQKSSEAP